MRMGQQITRYTGIARYKWLKGKSTTEAEKMGETGQRKFEQRPTEN